MHIGTIHLYGRSFPPEIRLEKESWALVRAGHKVTILTHKILENEESYEEMAPNFFVRREVIKKSHPLMRFSSFFTLHNRHYFSPIAKFIQEYKPDVLHVHDFIQIPTVLRIAARYNKPVVADLHENMPAALKANRASKPVLERCIYAALFNYSLWRWHEARNLSKCVKILVVVPEAAERLYQYGISKDNIVIVSNTEDETTINLDPEKVDTKIVNKYKDFWMVSYIGGIGPHRGIDTTVRSLQYIKNNIKNFKLVIVGLRDQQKQEFFSLARSVNCEDLIELIEWLPFEKVKDYIFASRVCLVPHNDFEHTQTTVPHKLFQYMICGKPVLVSNCRPLRRIVEDAQAGRVFRANDAQDLAKKLIEMFRNPAELERMGKNGHGAALGKYSWRHDAKRLIEAYDDILLRIVKEGLSDRSH